MADYLYGSANLHARMGDMIGRERMEELLSAPTVEQIYLRLSEYGIKVIKDPETGLPDREKTLSFRLRAAYDAVKELAPNAAPLRLWCYPYDCNNLKMVIKCEARGIDPDAMLFDFGTVDADSIVKMTVSGSFEGLSPHLAQAAKEAKIAFLQTRDPQVVDLILDRACYIDMTETARESDNAYVIHLVGVTIDLCNLLTAGRILRMQKGEALSRLLLEKALLEGGEALARSLFLEADNEEELLASLRATRYGDIITAWETNGGSFAHLECLIDNYRMKTIKEAKFMPVGPEAMVAYLLAHEYEVKALRILLSGKQLHLDVRAIRERICESYV